MEFKGQKCLTLLEATYLRLPLCKTSNPGCFRKIIPIIRVLHVVLGNVSAKYLLTTYWILWPWWHFSVSTVCLLTKCLAKWHSCAGMSQAKYRYYQPIITFIHTELLSAGRVFCWWVEAWMCLLPSRTYKSQCDCVYVCVCVKVRFQNQMQRQETHGQWVSYRKCVDHLTS